MAQDEKNGDGDDEKGDDREYYGKDRRRPAREYDHLGQFIDDPWKKRRKEEERERKGKEFITGLRMGIIPREVRSR